MEKFLLNERETTKLLDELKKRYTVNEVSFKKGEFKRAHVIKTGGFFGTSTGLSLERFEEKYALKFYSPYQRYYLILIVLTFLLAISIILPIIFILLAYLRYQREQVFNQEITVSIVKGILKRKEIQNDLRM